MNGTSPVWLTLSWNPATDIADMFSYDFMRSAFIAGTVVAALAGLVGYFVVLRRLAFAGEALSHVAFAAALGAVLLGIDPLAGMVVITVVLAMVMGGLSESTRSNDVVIGTVLAWVLGLGAFFLSIYTSNGGGNNGKIGVSTLFGSIFGISTDQVRLTVVASIAAAGVLILIGRPLLFASIDPAVAIARGLPARFLGVVLLGLVAVTVAESVPVVGALLVLALLVLPAAVAQRLTARPYRALLLSSCLAVSFTWLGLAVGYYTPYPVSFLITTIAFGTYLLTLAGIGLRRRLAYQPMSELQSP